jgi:hypothetical protein
MKTCGLVLMVLLSLKAGAVVRWTGSAGNGLWADPLNWENAILPGASDDVLLDNSVLASGYTVRLPDFAVTIRSLHVAPSGLQLIEIDLPLSNTVSSASGSLLDRAFTTTGNGYTILLERGAVFLNASGSSSGYSLRINDSLLVKNGAKYIHRTRTGHAELVQVLSKSPGSETGIFRFENPDAASTISLSGRSFGSLQLSAVSSISGLVSYSASGTNGVMIRGDLVLEAGTTLAINLSDTITVNGNLVMNTAVFNMATGSRSLVLALEGNWLQTGGTIIETNAQQKTGTILMKGRQPQTINNTGVLVDSIAVAIANVTGVSLQQPLRCSYQLQLLAGQLHSSTTNLLSLSPKATMVVDSTLVDCFIDGPVKKEGLANNYFLFPVGKNGHQRWMALRNATGDIVVEYHAATALNIGGSLGAGIDHVSAIEYWSVNNASPVAAQAELSFDNQLSGGVSELTSLRVAAFSTGTWQDAGNINTTGAAFGKGSVTSGSIANLGSSVQFICLASSSSLSNTLPIFVEDQWMEQGLSHWYCNWRATEIEAISSFEIELSQDGRLFEKLVTITAGKAQKNYRQSLPESVHGGFCRINLIYAGGKTEKGELMRFGQLSKSGETVQLNYAMGATAVQVQSDQNRAAVFELFDAAGRLIVRKQVRLYKGVSSIAFGRQKSAAGIYWVRLTANGVLLARRALLIQ